MKRIVIVLLSVLCGLSLFAACTGGGEGGGSEYDPTEVDDTVVESVRTDGVKAVTDALGGKLYLVRMTGEEAGIRPGTSENASVKIQQALDRLSSEYGGGLLYLSSGVYRLGTQINLPQNTGIVGDWVAPVGENAGKIVSGTVLDILFGAGTDSGNREDAAIRLQGNNLLSGLTIGYSNQTASSLRKYPYTVANGHSVGFNLENLTFLNSYRGILCDDQNVFKLQNIYMTALYEGIKDHYNYDIPTYHNVTVSYRYWTMAGEAFNAPSEDEARSLTRQATAFLFGRVDWMYLDTTLAEGYQKGYYYYRNTALDADIREANGQYLYMNAEDCQYGIYVDTTSKIGNLYTRCDLSVTGAESAAVYFSENVSKDAYGADDWQTGYQFNSCTFASDQGYGVYSLGKVVLNLTYCSFDNWGDCGLYAEDGSYALDHCTFEDLDRDVRITEDVQSFKTVACIYKGTKQIENGLAGVSDGERFLEAETAPDWSIPQYDRERYVMSEVSEPASRTVYYASDYGAVADGTLMGLGTDNTHAIQRALNAAGSHGGGYVVLDAGYYLVKERLWVPSGVHLVGNSVANKHFVGGRNAACLVTEYGKGGDKGDNPFITMSDDSALRSINVYYIDQDAGNPVAYSPTVGVFGDNVQIEETIFVASSINFYVTGENAMLSYTRGLGLNAGCIVEGVESGKFESMFFSINDWMSIPHWGNSMPNCPPEGFQNRYPNFENDTFVFEDCKNVTVYHSFSYAQGTGLRLEGNVENFHGIGIGIDMGRSSLILNNSGKNNVFVNTQFASYENHVLATEKYTGETSFYVSSSWFSGPEVTSTLGGSGVLNFQQFKMQTGSVTVVSGTVRLQGMIFDALSGYALVFPEGGEAEGGMSCSVGGINGLYIEGETPENFEIIACTKRKF